MMTSFFLYVETVALNGYCFLKFFFDFYQKMRSTKATKRTLKELENEEIKKNETETDIYVEGGVLKGVSHDESLEVVQEQIRSYAKIANENLKNKATCVLLWNVPRFVEHFELIDLINEMLPQKSNTDRDLISTNGVLQLDYRPSHLGIALVRLASPNLANKLVKQLDGYTFFDKIKKHNSYPLVTALITVKQQSLSINETLKKKMKVEAAYKKKNTVPKKTKEPMKIDT
ncbi:hypothetical protein RFI_10291 [Reticulomyxa filosa]|uniref:Uncharacterized protein n=1 Tax=Reticulomyxa filosa TaxID=46433 RepID=X6NLR1_RETFI|nr:hypothetical protein RFI_10291 [Reticulomyxa filosa]|eukprot:ETO26843.1 hypothetical protein RFI_10291 [Reticulomyxa filosa]